MLILDEVRCPNCNRKLMELSGQAQIRCSKCKALLHIDTENDVRKIYVKEPPKK